MMERGKITDMKPAGWWMVLLVLLGMQLISLMKDIINLLILPPFADFRPIYKGLTVASSAPEKFYEENEFFLYPPTFLTLFTPFKWFSMESAKNCLLFINVIMMLSLPWFLVDIAGGEKSLLNLIIWLILTLGFQPLSDTIYNAQTSIILAYMITLTIWGMVKGKWSVVGWAISLGIGIKIYPILFLPWLVMRRLYKALSWVIIWLVILISFSLIQFGPEIHLSYLRTKLLHLISPLNEATASFWQGLHFNLSFSNYGYLLFGKIGERSFYLAALGLVFGGLLYCWKRKDISSQSLLREAGFIILSMPLLSRIVWLHHYASILPVIAIIMSFINQGEWPKNQFMLVLIILAIVTFYSPEHVSWGHINNVDNPYLRRIFNRFIVFLPSYGNWILWFSFIFIT